MEREYRADEWLDENGNNTLIVRYVLLPDFSEIERFAVIFITNENGEMVEVAKIDGNQTEKVHIHFSFISKPKKIIDQPVSWETLTNAVERIKANWRIYLSRHREAKGL